MQIDIYAHSGTYGTSSIATGSALATSDVIASSDLPADYEWITFTLSGANQITINKTTAYEIVYRYSGSNNSSNYTQIGGTNAGSATGNLCYKEVSTWYAVSGEDLLFELTLNYRLPAASNVAIEAAHASKDRYDLITIDSSGVLAVTKGTDYDPATEPVVPPALPSNKTLLAYVFVEHGATEITNLNITDARVYNKNWRLLHWDSNAAGTTPTSESFDYEAYMAAKELLIITTGQSLINVSSTDSTRRGKRHTITVAVDGSVKATGYNGKAIGINVATVSEDAYLASQDETPLYCKLINSDMTLAEPHTIRSAISSADWLSAPTSTTTDSYNITSLIILAR
jgi:hypothetical protein